MSSHRLFAAMLPGRRVGVAFRAASLLASSVAWLGAAMPAAAALTHYANEASWRAAAGATTTIGVPNIPQGAINMQQLGLSGAGAAGVPIPSFLAGAWSLPAGTTIMQVGVGGTWSTEWTFTQPTVTAFAIDWLFNPGIQTGVLGADVYLGTTHVGSVGWQPASQIPGPPRFYGFTSSLPFNRVVITAQGQSWGRAVMFSQIPAPSALALLALAPLATRRRRRA
ncbi:MAG: hypothetical protein NTU45_11905 [Planctomycetota bacterium]|nr:hypothetical protein [Planctomycetota bacterium]